MKRAYKINILIGALLILMGLFIQSSALIDVLRTTPVDQLQQNFPGFSDFTGFMERLLVGAMLFKISLVILGILIIALGKMSIMWKPETISDELHSGARKRFALVILSVILFTSLVLRLYKLNNGLWIDEILTYLRYAGMPFGEIITTYHSANNHILYSLLAHSSFCIFGESAWALRLPAVLFGVGSIWAIYLLGRQIGSVREGLLSAALFTFSGIANQV